MQYYFNRKITLKIIKICLAQKRISTDIKNGNATVTNIFTIAVLFQQENYFKNN
jgi:hypothetical protein